MKDVLIIGSGITGCTLAWTWLLQGKSVVMISNKLNASSSVAAGVYNPTVLKRFTPIWKAQEQIDSMLPFYQKVENRLAKTFMHHVPLLRRLHDAAEGITWTRKAQREDLKNFMSAAVDETLVQHINAPDGFGRVAPAGWCDTSLYMQTTIHFLTSTSSFINESFAHDVLELTETGVRYKNVEAKHIIFAEGFAMRHNPFYKHLPLQGNKGELLIIRIPNYTFKPIIKSSVFLMHFKDDLFWVGATYDRDDLTLQPTDNALQYLTSRLEKFLKVPYQIVEHKVGIRPTTSDRRPFIGSTDPLKRHAICNGMGSRAVLLAPWAATQLYEFLVNGNEIDSEADCNRFMTSQP